jgi:hypothetical protein
VCWRALSTSRQPLPPFPKHPNPANRGAHLAITSTIRRSGAAALPAASFAEYVTTQTHPGVGTLVSTAANAAALHESGRGSAAPHASARSGRRQDASLARAATAAPSKLSKAAAPASTYCVACRTATYAAPLSVSTGGSRSTNPERSTARGGTTEPGAA